MQETKAQVVPVVSTTLEVALVVSTTPKVVLVEAQYNSEKPKKGGSFEQFRKSWEQYSAN